MWNITSTTDAISTAFTNTGTILTAVIGTILTAVIALMGLGFAYRHIKKYVTGKKF